MNAACNELGPWAIHTCNSTAHTCDSVSGDITEALTPIIYALFSMGALYTANGAIRVTDMGVRTIAHCVDQISKRHFKAKADFESEGLIQHDSGEGRSVKKEKPSSRWDSFMSVWNSIFKTGRTFCIASLCIATGIPLYQFIHLLESKCGDISPSCTYFKADTIDSCYWANNWLIDVIKEIIKSQAAIQT